MDPNPSGPSLHAHKFNSDLPDIPEDASQSATTTSPETKRKSNSHRWSIQSYPAFGGQTGMGRPDSMNFFDASAIETARSQREHGDQNTTIWPPPPKFMQQDPGPKEEEEKGPSWLLVLSLFMSVFLSALDITIITTALPTIADDMGTNATGFTWIGSAYLLAGGASEPIWAKCSDIFGRKPVLLLANVVFLGGSVICAVSKSIGVLILGRVTQGLGSGGLLVLVNVLIGDLFSPRRRGSYYGLLGLVWAVANAIGPLLGGMFSEKMGWQWCFWINVPCDGIALIMTACFLKVHTPHTPFWEGIKSIDWLGSATILGGTVMILVGLEFGGVTFPWNSAAVLCLIVFGFVIWALFFLVEAKVSKYPLIPLHLFKNLSNLMVLAVDFSHGFVFIAGSYFLPVYFQAILGATPLLSGVYLFPFVISLSVSAVATGQIIAKTGSYKPLITGGMLLMTLGFALFIDLPPTTSWVRIIIYQIIAGLGVGTNFQSPMLALQANVKPQEIGPATSTFGFVRQLANAVSLVFGNVILQSQLMAHRQTFFDTGMARDMVNMLTTDGMAVASVGQINTLPDYQREITRDLFAQSLQKAWILYAAVGIVGLGLCDFIQAKVLSWDHEETKTGLEAQEEARQDRINEKMATIGVLPDIDSPEPFEERYNRSSAHSLGMTLQNNRLSPPQHQQGMMKRNVTPPALMRQHSDDSGGSHKSSSAVRAAKTDGFGTHVTYIEDVHPSPRSPHTRDREGAIRGARRRSNLKDARMSAISTGASASSFGGGLALGKVNPLGPNDYLTPRTPRSMNGYDEEDEDYMNARSPITPSAGYFPASSSSRPTAPDALGQRAARADNDWYDDVITNRNVHIEQLPPTSPDPTSLHHIPEVTQPHSETPIPHNLLAIHNQLRDDTDYDDPHRPLSHPSIRSIASSQFERRIHIDELEVDEGEGGDLNGKYGGFGEQRHLSAEERYKRDVGARQARAKARMSRGEGSSAWRSSSPAYSLHEELPVSPVERRRI